MSASVLEEIVDQAGGAFERRAGADRDAHLPRVVARAEAADQQAVRGEQRRAVAGDSGVGKSTSWKLDWLG